MISKTQSIIQITVALAFGVIGATTFPSSSISQTHSIFEISQNCTAAQRGNSQNCPLPISFSQGAYGALVNGRLNASPQTRYYSLVAKAGQRLTLSFTGAGALRAGITFPGGSGDGPFSGEGNTIELPRTGTYIISIGQNTMSGEPWQGNFTMAILVK